MLISVTKTYYVLCIHRGEISIIKKVHNDKMLRDIINLCYIIARSAFISLSVTDDQQGE